MDILSLLFRLKDVLMFYNLLCRSGITNDTNSTAIVGTMQQIMSSNFSFTGVSVGFFYVYLVIILKHKCEVNRSRVLHQPVALFQCSPLISFKTFSRSKVIQIKTQKQSLEIIYIYVVMRWWIKSTATDYISNIHALPNIISLYQRYIATHSNCRLLVTKFVPYPQVYRIPFHSVTTGSYSHTKPRQRLRRKLAVCAH